jgi:citrate lyase subunit beta/citryl-CoA lyase
VLPTSQLVRRSVLTVDVSDASAVAEASRSNADAISLQPPDDLSSARARLPGAIVEAGRGGAEVFVRISRRRAYAQVNAALQSELRGVVLTDPETAAEIAELDAMLSEREREEGLLPGSVEIFPLLGTARGVWNVRELVTSSPRVACAALDEVRLSRSLGIVATDAFDALSFSRGRLIVETLAAVKLPLGLGHPLGARPRHVDDDDLLQVADRARNTGFKGAVCPFAAWVGVCNRAFTPTEEQVAYYRAMREAFAEGVARGTAAVPFPGGRMIDVPVDERAKLVIDWWERCNRRDAEKAAARQSHA